MYASKAPFSTLSAMLQTSAAHIAPSGGSGESFDQNKKAGFETRPAGNAVNLEDEMLKVSANQMDYAAATSLWTRPSRT